MGRRSLLCLLLIAASLCATAHPGTGLVIDKDGTIYFVDSVRNRIMKFKDGSLSVLFVDPSGERLSVPHHLFADGAGNLITGSDRHHPMLKISPDGTATKLYPSLGAEEPKITMGGDPFAFAPDGSLVFVRADQFTFSKLFRLTAGGKESFLAGGDKGHADERGADARFGSLHFSGMTFGPDGALYMTDSGTMVRKVEMDGTVTTIAGSTDQGYKDGKGSDARFSGAVGLTVLKDGTIYVAEYGNRRIRKISPDGNVSTVAGSGDYGTKDGPALQASFQALSGVAVGPDGTVYTYEMGDRDRPRIRRITKSGEVETVVYVPAVSGGGPWIAILGLAGIAVGGYLFVRRNATRNAQQIDLRPTVVP